METLQELLVEEIRDLYDAEKQLVKALPRFAKAANNSELKKAFQDHLRVTEEQIKRIERVFETLGEKARSKPCAAMKGLVEEGREILQEDAEAEMLDCAMIGAAQKVEHYEISGYGTARAMAEALGLTEAADLLRETEDEEGEADKLLTQIAEEIYGEVGAAAQNEGGEEEEEGGAESSSRSGSKSAGKSARGGAQAKSSSGGNGRGGTAQKKTIGTAKTGRGEEAARKRA
jgi:ferritin-like metal-binding protein YciE